MNNFIYLDYNATTPADPRVVEAMLPYFHQRPGNAASRSHAWGWMAEEAVDQARQQIAQLIGVDAEEIVFTSGATESDNLALKGVFEMYHRKGKHIITVKTEHNAVLDACYALEKKGAEVTYLEVDQHGYIQPNELEAAIRPDTILVSIMWANNETGVIQPMKTIGEICEKHGVLLMSDATQAVGKIPVAPKETGVHLVAFSAHKMYGPKGIGALYVSKRNPRVKLAAQIHGGGHEKGMRSGTLNVPAIVGFGKAAGIAREEMEKEAVRLRGLRDRIEKTLLTSVEASYLNIDPDKERLPHVTNLAFRHVEAEALMMSLKHDLAVSSGSACTSASLEPSHVLLAMGLDEDRAHCSIRISLGRYTQKEEVETATKKIVEAVEKARSISPIWMMFKEGLV